MMDGMVDLAKTPAQLEGHASPAVPEQCIYPYSTSISLEDEELEKLGLDITDEECQVGNYLQIMVLAEVTGKNIRSTTDGEKKCLNLQLTHMKVLGDEDSEHEEPDGDEHYDGKVIRAAGPY